MAHSSAVAEQVAFAPGGGEDQVSKPSPLISRKYLDFEVQANLNPRKPPWPRHPPSRTNLLSLRMLERIR